MTTTTPQSALRPYEGRRPYPLVIGGEEVTTGSDFAAIDPSTGGEWARVCQAGEAEVDAAVAGARKAFDRWRETGPALRQQLVLRIADAIEAAADVWERLLPTENGRPRREIVIGDIPSATGIFRYFASVVRDAEGVTIATEDTTRTSTPSGSPLGRSLR
jgi:aldehyde dehydrogenase (NAD+)